MERLRRRAVVGLVAVPCLAGLALVSPHVGQALIVSAPLDAPQAILSLGSHEWERLPAAAALARTYPNAELLLTVPRVVSEWNCHRCGERVAWLGELGVEPSRVRLLAGRVSNTHDEAVSALRDARERRVMRLLVVTSAYHTRRTLATFRHVFRESGIEVGVEPALTVELHPRVWWVHGYDRAYTVYEWRAVAFYWWRFGVNPFSPVERQPHRRDTDRVRHRREVEAIVAQEVGGQQGDECRRQEQQTRGPEPSGCPEPPARG